MGGRELKMIELSPAKKPRKAARSANVMDERIWKELPEELLEGVIARLPLRKLIHFRVVCKGWNSLPKSPSFKKHWAQVAPQLLPFVFGIAYLGSRNDKMVGVMYDPLMKKWSYTNYTMRHEQIESRVASDGGLVCHLDNACFVVGNHLTQTWKTFCWSTSSKCIIEPFRPHLGAFAVGLVDCTATTGGWKLLRLSTNGEYEVYDSLKGSSPTTTGRILASRGVGVNTVTIGSIVYFRILEPYGIICYDVLSGKWEQQLFPDPPNLHYVTSVALAECGGRLLLAGVVGEHNTASDISVCVWEQHGLSWREVDRMPSSWCRAFNGKTVAFHCLSNRRLLVMSCWASRADQIFVYDVITREWSKAPLRSPSGKTPRGRNVVAGIGFFPCFSASP